MSAARSFTVSHPSDHPRPQHAGRYNDAVKSIAADLDDILSGIYATADSFIQSKRVSSYFYPSTTSTTSSSTDNDVADDSGKGNTTAPATADNDEFESFAAGIRRAFTLASSPPPPPQQPPPASRKSYASVTAAAPVPSSASATLGPAPSTNDVSPATALAIAHRNSRLLSPAPSAALSPSAALPASKRKRMSDRALLQDLFSFCAEDVGLESIDAMLPSLPSPSAAATTTTAATATTATAAFDAAPEPAPEPAPPLASQATPLSIDAVVPPSSAAAPSADPASRLSTLSSDSSFVFVSDADIEEAVREELKRLEEIHGVQFMDDIDEEPSESFDESQPAAVPANEGEEQGQDEEERGSAQKEPDSAPMSAPAPTPAEPIYAVVTKGKRNTESMAMKAVQYESPQDAPYSDLGRPSFTRSQPAAVAEDEDEGYAQIQYKRKSDADAEAEAVSAASTHPASAASVSRSGTLSFASLPKPPPAPPATTASASSSSGTSASAPSSPAAGAKATALAATAAAAAAASSSSSGSSGQLKKEPDNSFKRKIAPMTQFVRQMAFKRIKNRNNVAQGLISFFTKITTSKATPEGRTIENFIVCTKESKDQAAYMLCSNIRQFLDGMTNYVNEKRRQDVTDIVAKFAKDPSIMMLNVDAIIEGTLQSSIIAPLKQFICKKITGELQAKGALQLFAENSRELAAQSQQSAGIREKFVCPTGWGSAILCLQKMQKAVLPIKKLECLLACVTCIYQTVEKTSQLGGQQQVVLGADDFLPIFIYVLAQAGIDTAEVEAEYMWGLLDPAILTGEGGYYLTVLSSAVHVLKTSKPAPAPESAAPASPKASASSAPAADSSRSPRIADMHGFLRVHFSDMEMRVFKTIPVRPMTTTREAVRQITEKMKLQPGDYWLYELNNGAERQLEDSDYPQQVKAKWPATATENLYQIIFRRKSPLASQ